MIEISLEISFGSETFRLKFCEISREIALENSREQRTKFAEFRLHYFCTILYEILRDQDLLEEVPPWYSPVMPKPVYKSEQVEAWWDVPVYADHQEVRVDGVDARVVNHVSKKVMTIEMSCPWISDREKKSEEKTMKYGPLRWELKEKYKGYEVHQYNIIMDVLGGWSEETEISVQSLVGRKTTHVLERMQKAVLSATLNIARTFKVVT